ncbi:hypothetical protein D9M69_510590 [compost metagenome]
MKQTIITLALTFLMGLGTYSITTGKAEEQVNNTTRQIVLDINTAMVQQLAAERKDTREYVDARLENELRAIHKKIDETNILLVQVASELKALNGK